MVCGLGHWESGKQTCTVMGSVLLGPFSCFHVCGVSSVPLRLSPHEFLVLVGRPWSIVLTTVSSVRLSLYTSVNKYLVDCSTTISHYQALAQKREKRAWYTLFAASSSIGNMHTTLLHKVRHV